jgi:hypothetical protein
MVGNTATKDELIAELKANTDEFGLAARLTKQTLLTDKLREIKQLPPFSDTDDWFQKATTNPHLRIAVITPWQVATYNGKDLDRHWPEYATLMESMIASNPDWDQVASKTSPVPVNDVKVENDHKRRAIIKCHTCGKPGHSSKECRSTNCADCNADLSDANRQAHYFMGCPVRAADPRLQTIARNAKAKKQQASSKRKDFKAKTAETPRSSSSSGGTAAPRGAAIVPTNANDAIVAALLASTQSLAAMSARLEKLDNRRDT